MIRILYDEVKRTMIRQFIEESLNDGWEIIRIDLVNDQEDYAVLFKKTEKENE